MITPKRIWTLLSIVTLMISSISAQNGALIETLNLEQINFLETSQKVIKENRQEFKKLLNEEQKALLKDKTITRKDRMSQLKSTLNADQLNVYATNREEDKKSRQAFRKSLTKEQREMLKKANEAHRNNKSFGKTQKKQLSEKIVARKKMLLGSN